MNKVNFLGEDDFIRIMKTENSEFRKTHVKQGKFQSFDGATLNYYFAIPENATKVVVFAHGFCEFFGKYHEYVWYLYQAGFGFFFPEQRGHGYSEGKMKEPDVVYIDDYDTYVEDFHIFMDKVVMPATPEKKRILIAHSMGGAVGTLFLEKYPGYFDKAVLSSPMLKMKSVPSKLVRSLLSIYAFLFGKRKAMAPGQKHFDGVSVFETSSTKSRVRYDYMFEMRLKDEHYQTYGASIGWGLASYKVYDRIFKNASRLSLPITVFTAGQDHLIDSDGYTEFAGKVPGAKIIAFEDSRHEIFNAEEETRNEYFRQVLEIIDRD
ncbi:alpha/beta fold hydrolase [Butyrivibrio sp. INlla16]|uniref:alpha/beta fold hydrolase n=1 Tax=Butyrivibrio sp. INlla16 TaxID=1520807 RepID=UPI000889EC08|nr:alpha/beta fold hydrolase [Butyrivibrio sp. INlla16]SDB67162.1 lysophospholipase [Butyrivibrio sp. INlla16]